MGDSSGAASTPSAEGTLAARPLSHLLVYARTKRLTGRLVLRAPDGSGGAIALRRGQIAAARTVPPRAHFGSVASEMGFVDRATADATQREASEKKSLHGEILIAHGKITATQRDAVLTEQTCRKVHYLFGALPPASVFAFYEDAPSAAEPSCSLDPIAPLWRALRESASSDDVRGVLAPVVAKPLRIVNEAPVARAGLSADEQALVGLLISRPMTMAQMRQGFPKLPPDRIDRFVYLLLITKSAEPTAVSAAAMPAMRPRAGSMDADAIAAALKGSMRPAGATPRPSGAVPRNSVAPAYPNAMVGQQLSSAPPRRVSGSVGSAVVPGAAGAPRFTPVPPSASSAPSSGPSRGSGPAELGAVGIALRADTVEDEDPFQTLALPANASAEAARAAYFTLVKMWHPDRLPAELAPVRIEVGKIFAIMSRAHHTLTDPEARRAFLAARDERAAALHRPRNAVIRLIDMAITQKDFAFAGDERRKLVAADPDDAEAHALAAWIMTSAGEGPANTLRAALSVLDRAISRDTQCERAHFYRGMINKRLGNAAGAYRDFARVVQLDPRHVDALREVRIHEMRMKKP